MKEASTMTMTSLMATKMMVMPGTGRRGQEIRRRRLLDKLSKPNWVPPEVDVNKGPNRARHPPDSGPQSQTGQSQDLEYWSGTEERT